MAVTQILLCFERLQGRHSCCNNSPSLPISHHVQACRWRVRSRRPRPLRWPMEAATSLPTDLWQSSPTAASDGRTHLLAGLAARKQWWAWSQSQHLQGSWLPAQTSLLYPIRLIVGSRTHRLHNADASHACAPIPNLLIFAPHAISKTAMSNAQQFCKCSCSCSEYSEPLGVSISLPFSVPPLHVCSVNLLHRRQS